MEIDSFQVPLKTTPSNYFVRWFKLIRLNRERRKKPIRVYLNHHFERKETD
jgi:hypothetical protein